MNIYLKIFNLSLCNKCRCFTTARHHQQLFAHRRKSSQNKQKYSAQLYTQIRETWAKAAVDTSPQSFQPYLRLMRFDKPIGTWLLYAPCAWSISLAATPGALPDFYLLALFGAGSFFMRGAGCVINDLWDKDFDKQVARTKNRPLASGQLTPLQALTFLSGLLSISLTILLQLNWFSVFLGSVVIIPVIAYPLAKRYTNWPQFVLGATINWGAMLGWSAVRGYIDYSVVVPLYVACLCWTILYDTIYAHQDKTDDAMIGVKSAALQLNNNSKLFLSACQTVMLSSLACCGYMCHQTMPFYIGVGATAAIITWQIFTLNVNDPADCWSKFNSNKYLALILFLSIVAGTYYRQSLSDETVAIHSV